MEILWNTLLVDPMLNGLLLLERVLFGSFGLAIITFTMLVRLATLPLTMKQLHASRKMQELNPRIQEIQKKYKDPKRRQEEIMKVYREAGANPVGCLGPMIIQMPIWFALYAVIRLVGSGRPEDTVELASRLYPLGMIQSAIPLPTRFLWLDLGQPDPTLVLVFLVAATTFLQTKLSTSAAASTAQSDQQQQTMKMMTWMMPVMFGAFTLQAPSGLAVYWVATNVIGAVMNWFVYGWNKRPFRDIFMPPGATGPKGVKPRPSAPRPSPALSDTSGGGDDGAATNGKRDKRTVDGQPGSKRKDSRGGNGQSAPAARSGPESGRRRSR